MIGVDDDTFYCEFCYPALSSVVPDPVRIGYEAADLLDRLMRQKIRTAGDVLIEPIGIAARQSTDALAIDDREVAEALNYIRKHACDGMNVSDLLARVSISRSSLERRFQACLGRSPREFIRAVQMDRVRRLLAETELKLEQIAELAGFRRGCYLSFAFKRETGETPRQFRCRVCRSK